MAWLTDTINPAVDSPATSIAAILNDFAKLRETFGNSLDAEIPVTLPLLNDKYVVFRDGEGGGDVTASLQVAAALSNASGKTLLLPPWPVHFSETFQVNKMEGTPGMSVLVPAPAFTRTGFANQFMILNSNFSQAYNSGTANEVMYKGFDIAVVPGSSGSVIGLANVKKLKISRVNITAARVLDGLGKPYALDSLIDLYACVKNFEVKGCELVNVTGAYGTNKISEFGGSCMWIRNLTSDGTNAENVTEKGSVHHNNFTHMTSDEVLAVYGVFGTTRKVKIHHNNFEGLASIDGVYHTTFISIFPLRHPSAGGANAGVHGIDFFDNTVTDRAALYDVFRIGNGADANNPCYNNRSRGNEIHSIRSTDGTTGPRAVWLAITGGTDVNKPDPEVASSVYRCIDGNFGAAYFRDTSGNTSTDDVALNDGATVNTGFQSFQTVTNPTSLGDLYSGVANARLVFGGKVECAAYPFFNCRSVVGTNYRQNLVGGAVAYYNTAQGGVWGLKDTVGVSFGQLVEVTGAAPSDMVVGVYNNDCQMSGGASGYPTLKNESTTGAKIRARNNTTRGANSAITAGLGTIDRASNDWNGTTD
jgi:hypothetical protein